MMPETQIPGFWILTAAIVGLIVVGWFSFRTRRFISKRDRYVLLALRALAVVLIGLVAWNPSVEENYPDRDAFQVALLADLSASMHLADTGDGDSRLSTVEEMLVVDSDESLAGRLVGRYDFVQRGFSDGLIPGKLSTFKLNKPAQICVPFIQADVDGADGGPNGLSIWRYNGTEWVELNSTVNVSNGTVCANTSNFSSFALGLAVEAPSEEVVVPGAVGLPVTGGYAPDVSSLILAMLAGFALIGTGVFTARRARRARQNV